MSIANVAQLAGVSTSTVSRVLNERPNVARDKVESVKRAMRELSFVPVRRSARRVRVNDGLKTATIAFIVFGTSGSRPTPAFEQLLCGVSDASSKCNLSLIFSFVSDPLHLPRRITERNVDGLLLHGEKPGAEVQERLRSMPTVWLMANRQRPVWGDQVMPDNSAIGSMAAQYLLRRGHRRLAYLGTAASWSLEIRSLAFAHTAAEAGANVEIIQTIEEPGGDFWQRDGLSGAARSIAQRLASLKQPPTGLFIAEDRLVPLVDAALRLHGPPRYGIPSGDGMNGDGMNGDGTHAKAHRNGTNGDPLKNHVEIISCNNERSHFAGLESIPATIDIRAHSIGRLGVERLIWRLRNPDAPERVRCMVEPALVEGEN
jgi:DNA-binding LacI/PurR family transcriptional regulator